MTLMAFLLLIILFLVSFLYFSGLNPQEMTIYYLPDHSVTFSVAMIVVGCILFGLILGYLAHLYSSASHMFRSWRRERVEKKNQEISKLYREGVVRLLSGDLKKAHTLLQKAMDRNPSRIDVYIAMANVYLQEGNAQDGINLLLKARTLDPRSLEVLFRLGAAYEETGREEEAAKVYQDILEEESSNRKALRALRDLHIRHNRWQEALELQKRLIRAASGTSRAAEEKKKNLYLRYEVARQNQEAGEIDPAKEIFKEIIKEDPDFAPARVSLGDALRQQNRTEEAAQVWQDGYKALGRSIFLSRLEDLYLGAEDPSTLLGFYRQELLTKSDDLMLHLFYGKLCLRLEMVDEALDQLHAIESSGADFPQLHFLLAEAHRRRNRIDESIDEYKRALGINSHLQLGYLCDECGETTEQWQSRCPACGTWGSLGLAGHQQIRSHRPPEVREIHHGERDQWTNEETAQ